MKNVNKVLFFTRIYSDKSTTLVHEEPYSIGAHAGIQAMTTDNLVKTANDTIANHELFGNLLSEDEKRYLMDRGVVRSFSTGQVICRQLERDANLYIILLGEVEVTEGENNKVILAHLGKGEVFGEVAALFRMPRISTVRATKPSVVLEITGDLFEWVLERNPILLKAIIQRIGERLIETALRSVSFLRYMPITALTSLVQEASLVSIAPGGIIVKEGEPGDAMFIMVHGAARVTHSLEGQALPIAIIGSGDYFGEWSILTGAPRTATVVALSHIEAIQVERGTLLNFIQHHPEVRDRIDQIAHNRYDDIHTSQSGPGADGQMQKSIKDINRVLGKNP